jgi:hypothetical protein
MATDRWADVRSFVSRRSGTTSIWSGTSLLSADAETDSKLLGPDLPVTVIAQLNTYPPTLISTPYLTIEA